MANDEEYMRKVIEVHGELPKGSKHPALTSWTSEVSMLAKIKDQLAATHALLVKVNAKPGAASPNIEPEPRPMTIVVKLEWEQRLSKHKRLAARLLGDRSS